MRKQYTRGKAETFEWNGLVWRRWPESTRLSSRAYFKNKTTWLHRAVWEHHYGPIPKGFHVHHKDGNSLNNDISNLECMAPGEHHRHHGAAASDDVKAKRLAALGKAQLAAAKWHSSPKGREWHRRHAKAIAANRPDVVVQCEVCGVQFEAKHANRRVCGGTCYARRHRARLGAKSIWNA